MIIRTPLDIGQIVFLVTDIKQRQRMITAIKIEGRNSIKYCLSLCEEETWHFDIEISTEKNELICILD